MLKQIVSNPKMIRHTTNWNEAEVKKQHFNNVLKTLNGLFEKLVIFRENPILALEAMHIEIFLAKVRKIKRLGGVNKL